MGPYPYPDPNLFRIQWGFLDPDEWMGKLQLLIKKKILAVFFQYLVIKTLDPDSLEMLDPDPGTMNLDPQY